MTRHTELKPLNSCIDTHNIEGTEGNTERGLHTLPHTRQAAGPVDYGERGGAADRLGGASRSIWPEEKLCGLFITISRSYRSACIKERGEVFMWGKKMRLSTVTINTHADRVLLYNETQENILVACHYILSAQHGC